MSEERSHVDFQNSLRAWLQTPRSSKHRPPIVFTEIALAGSWGSEGRLDVVTFSSRNEYRELKVRGFEVKVSRNDLLGDLRSKKWHKYLPYVHEFYFAFPDGLATVDEIPEPAGVIIMTEGGGFKFIRRSKPLDATGVDASVVARLLWRANSEKAAMTQRVREAERQVRLVEQQAEERIARIEARYEAMLTARNGSDSIA